MASHFEIVLLPLDIYPGNEYNRTDVLSLCETIEEQNTMKVACLLVPHLAVQVERHINPSLSAGPLVVGGRPWDAGAVLDCCPEAIPAGVVVEVNVTIAVEVADAELVGSHVDLSTQDAGVSVEVDGNRFAGIAISVDTDQLPADSPNTVTLPGSPPNRPM